MTQETQNQKTAFVAEATASQQENSDFEKLLAKERSLELSCFNNDTFDQLYKVAEMMAKTGTIPDSLRKEGKKGFEKDLPFERVVANCFLVAEQAHRWGVSPFSIAPLAAIIYGKLGWEGKLVNALIQKFAGIRLSFEFNDKSGDDLGVTVIGKFPNESTPRTIQGTVKSWKTTGTGSPWVMTDEIALKRQLTYRGAREWKNIHAPGVMLGVMTTDEIQDFSKDSESVPVITREQLAEQIDKTSLETNTAKERAELIRKVNQAWDALGKTSKDFQAACEYYKVGDAEAFDEYPTGALEILLKTLQKQMNAQAGKTQGQIEKEKAARAAKQAEKFELEGDVA